jgi:ATP dependent DNA ligase domain
VAAITRGVPPKFVRPCIPTTAKTISQGDAWLHEPKLDGYRFQIVKDGRQVRLYSRNGHEWTKRLAGLAEALQAIPRRAVVLEGLGEHFRLTPTCCRNGPSVLDGENVPDSEVSLAYIVPRSIAAWLNPQDRGRMHRASARDGRALLAHIRIRSERLIVTATPQGLHPAAARRPQERRRGLTLRV